MYTGDFRLKVINIFWVNLIMTVAKLCEPLVNLHTGKKEKGRFYDVN